MEIAEVAVTATYSYTSAGYVGAGTITLTPQTTPFTPVDTVRHNGCSTDLYCAFSPAYVTPGQTCLAWDWVDWNHGIGMRRECYPSGYYDLFWQGTQWSELSIGSSSVYKAYRPNF